MIAVQRLTADAGDEFCVFLIGMRVNRRWKVHKWWPVAMAMPRMLKELLAHPKLGCLGGHQWAGNPTILVQHWKSFEALERYAKDPNLGHLPAWTAFNREMRTPASGTRRTASRPAATNASATTCRPSASVRPPA